VDGTEVAVEHRREPLGVTQRSTDVVAVVNGALPHTMTLPELARPVLRTLDPNMSGQAFSELEVRRPGGTP
jgi:hypothetical protein